MIKGFSNIYIDNLYGIAFVISQLYYAIVLNFILNPCSIRKLLKKKEIIRRSVEIASSIVIVFVISCFYASYFDRPYFMSILTVFDMVSLTFSILLVAYNVIFLRKNLAKQAVIAMLFNCLFCVQSSLAGWFGTCQDYVWHLDSSINLTLIFNLVGMVLIAVFLIKYNIDRFAYIPAALIMLVSGFFVITFVDISLFRLYILQWAESNSPYVFFPIYSSLIILAVLIYIMIYLNAKEYNDKMMERRIIDNNNSYMQMMQISENKYASLQKMKHDTKNQFLMLKTFSDEKKYDELQEYLNNYLSTMGALDISSYCGNQLVNNILNIAYDKCGKEGITLSTKILVPGTLNIAPVDLCSLILNLVDNAIHALTNESGGGSKKIDLEIKYVNDSLFIEISNYSNKNYAPYQLDALIRKKNSNTDHGWGLKIIQGIVDRYNGSFKLECSNNLFIAYVYVALKKE